MTLSATCWSESALLEQARERHKLGQIEEARALRERLVASGRLSLVQRLQLAAYWDEYVAQMA